MPNTKNIAEVKELAKKLDTASAIFLADYAGLSVTDQVKLRAAVEATGGELRVTKNSLLKIALEQKGLKTAEIAEELQGPNVTLFTGADSVAPLKTMVEFAKGNESEKPALKTGFLGSELLTLARIKQLASLPSKNELLAKLLGTLSNPARNMVGVLTAPTRNLLYAFNAIKDQKAKNA